jgi:DNA-binding transcriptional ArsR family regulator
METQWAPASVDRVAEMFSALGNEARVRIVRLLLAAHPDGLVVGEIQSELGIPNSTLSHHLEKLKHQGLVNVRRDRQFLWYTANSDALRDLLVFLFAECCTRNSAVRAEEVVQIR